MGNSGSVGRTSLSLRYRTFSGLRRIYHRYWDARLSSRHTVLMNRAQHILVVDDEPDLRKLVSDFLTRNGYHVFEARDGVAMMESLRELIW